MHILFNNLRDVKHWCYILPSSVILTNFMSNKSDISHCTICQGLGNQRYPVIQQSCGSRI